MGNELNEGERLVKVETQLENVLKEMTTLSNSFSRLEAKLDKRENSFVTKDVLDEKLKLRDEKIEGIQKAIVEMRVEKQNEKTTNKQIFPNWIQAVFAIAAFGVSIFAIIYK
jgi:hypothetical protein